MKDNLKRNSERNDKMVKEMAEEDRMVRKCIDWNIKDRMHRERPIDRWNDWVEESVLRRGEVWENI